MFLKCDKKRIIQNIATSTESEKNNEERKERAANLKIRLMSNII